MGTVARQRGWLAATAADAEHPHLRTVLTHGRGCGAPSAWLRMRSTLKDGRFSTTVADADPDGSCPRLRMRMRTFLICAQSSFEDFPHLDIMRFLYKITTIDRNIQSYFIKKTLARFRSCYIIESSRRAAHLIRSLTIQKSLSCETRVKVSQRRIIAKNQTKLKSASEKKS